MSVRTIVQLHSPATCSRGAGFFLQRHALKQKWVDGAWGLWVRVCELDAGSPERVGRVRQGHSCQTLASGPGKGVRRWSTEWGR